MTSTNTNTNNNTNTNGFAFFAATTSYHDNIAEHLLNTTLNRSKRKREVPKGEVSNSKFAKFDRSSCGSNDPSHLPGSQKFNAYQQKFPSLLGSNSTSYAAGGSIHSMYKSSTKSKNVSETVPVPVPVPVLSTDELYDKYFGAPPLVAPSPVVSPPVVSSLTPSSVAQPTTNANKSNRTYASPSIVVPSPVVSPPVTTKSTGEESSIVVEVNATTAAAQQPRRSSRISDEAQAEKAANAAAARQKKYDHAKKITAALERKNAAPTRQSTRNRTSVSYAEGRNFFQSHHQEEDAPGPRKSSNNSHKSQRKQSSSSSSSGNQSKKRKTKAARKAASTTEDWGGDQAAPRRNHCINSLYTHAGGQPLFLHKLSLLKHTSKTPAYQVINDSVSCLNIEETDAMSGGFQLSAFMIASLDANKGHAGGYVLTPEQVSSKSFRFSTIKPFFVLHPC